MMIRTAVAALFLLALATLAGCAQDVGEIDRVQPGALAKSLFEGEWYFQRTVVDVPYTVGFTFIGETEELERVRWEIHEDRLVAYRSYDFIDNTDLSRARRAKPGETVTGQPIASYEIVKQFDIQREYSATTGEQGNVLLEDDQDRPWYNRAYIRVNWANNGTTNFNFTLDDIPTEPVQFAITDPADPDAFTLGWRDATQPTGWRESRDPTTHRKAKKAEYIDFVTKILAKPEKFAWWDPWWGAEAWPACWFYLNIECKSSEVEIRTSLMLLDPAEDYEPLEYPDNYIARDANGKAIRVKEHSVAKPKSGQNYDYHHLESKGVARDDDGHIVRIPMFDKFGFFRVERYGYDARYGEVDAARRYYISRYNLWQKSRDAQGKSIPYAQRKVRPIVYYLGQGFPDELLATAELLAKNWDGVFRDVVGALQGKKAADVGPVFVLAKNTLSKGPDGTIIDRGQRVGDMRFSLLNLVEEPTRAGLLGYGPSATDPVTGQVISAAAHSYGGPLREYATMGRDIIRLARGELDPQEYGLGHISDEEVKSHLAAFAGNKGAKGSKSGKSSAKDYDKFMASVSAFAKKFATPAKRKQVQAMRKKYAKLPNDFASQRLAAIRGTKIEDRLITRDIALAFGTPADKAALSQSAPGTPMPPLTAEQKERMSPASWAALGAKLRQVKRRRLLASNTMYHKSFADDAVLGLVESLANSDSNQVWQKLFASVFRSTAEHEVGHTLGLRHNFEASSDALNYSDEYWKLRTKSAPKPLDVHSLTDDQKKAGINDHRYSSIMDYHGRFHTDLQGLGRYDRAAIAFGYGQLVEVWDDAPAKAIRGHKMFNVIGSEVRRRMNDMTDDKYPAVDKEGAVTGDPKYAGERDLLDSALRGLIHYTSIPALVGGHESIGARKLVPYSQIIDQRTGAASKAKDKPAPLTHFEVPYRFCSDEYEMGTPTCSVYDEGADPLEIVSGALNQWRDYYFINAFRRGRIDFDLGYYQFRVWFRYFHPVIRQYQYWVFDIGDDEDVTNPGSLWDYISDVRPADAGMDLDADGYGPWWSDAPHGGNAPSAAVKEGITRLAAAIAVPEPGNYCYDSVIKQYKRQGASTTLPVCDKVESCYLNESGACIDSTDCKAMFGKDSACVWDDNELGRFCGMRCKEDTDCPSGLSCWEMASLENTTVQVCALDQSDNGAACTGKDDCTGHLAKDSACVTQATGLGPFCGKPCATNADCPARFECRDVTSIEGDEVKQCVTEQQAGCVDLVVPLGQGRHSYTEFDYDTGYYFYERLRYAGSFYDKLAALEVLTDPTTYFIDTDVSEPVRNYVVSIMWYFREEMMRFLGGLAAGKQENIGYRVDKDRNLVPPDPFATPGANAGLGVVPVPNMYNLRPYTSYLGMALLNMDWDQSFNDSSKIWLEGADDAITPPASAAVASFFNPLNNRTYKAVKMGDPAMYSIGFTMVQDNEKLAKLWLADKSDWDARYALEWESQHVEIVRGLYNIYGYFWW